MSLEHSLTFPLRKLSPYKKVKKNLHRIDGHFNHDIRKYRKLDRHTKTGQLSVSHDMKKKTLPIPIIILLTKA